MIPTLRISAPPWSPTKVRALPMAVRQSENRQGLTKGEKAKGALTKGRVTTMCPPDPSYRTRPELAVELIGEFAKWLHGRKVLVRGDSTYGGKGVLKRLPQDVDPIKPAGSPPTRRRISRRCRVHVPAMVNCRQFTARVIESACERQLPGLGPAEARGPCD